MPMLDDFNPNVAEPVEHCCPECGFNPDGQAKLEKDVAKSRATIERLRGALMSMISIWKDPGTLYEMPRAVSYAQSVHDDTHP